MKYSIIFTTVIALALSSQVVFAGEITDPAYGVGDPLTAEIMNNIRTAVNDNNATKQNRVTGSCLAGSSISVINADGTVGCEVDDDTVAISGVRGVNLSSSITITTTTHTEIATVTITDSGAFDVALNAHATIEIKGASISRLQLEIRNTSCTGAIRGQAMWRPGGSASDSTLYANTISLTGFEAKVLGPEVYVLCARKYDSSFPDALIFYRGLSLSYSN